MWQELEHGSEERRRACRPCSRERDRTLLSVRFRRGAEVRSRVTVYSFRLFVVGQTERSREAVANLRFVCESRVPGRYEIEVVDAAERPDLAGEERILATPTVVRLAPLPQQRVIGDLSDHGRTTAALGLPDPDVLSSGWR